MGLDMFAVSTSKPIEELTPEERSDGIPSAQLHYWRKHNALHGWMEQLYRKRGGEEQFNGVAVHLSAEDLDSLELAVKTRALTPTEGFFFGSTNYTASDWVESQKDDLAFIAKAREALAAGQHVYYDSWW